ncbi:hypothetical protein LEP1GSC123_4740 [Leptospira borgpetersenii str. 200701203]|uniref:Uncharacterized protein n=1 Tax=Leptospira borgpetersenii str. 200701203 TaxID=1193007 RepID=M3FBM2_LEPBO|nr:hypothetical protein LEP1GSC123_4740 [Leptospira borgpetersenii str. 200701203]
MKTYKLSIIQLLLIFIVFLFSEIDAKKREELNARKFAILQHKESNNRSKFKNRKRILKLSQSKPKLKNLKKTLPGTNRLNLAA